MMTGPLSEQAREDITRFVEELNDRLQPNPPIDTWGVLENCADHARNAADDPRNQVAANDRDEQRAARLDADRSLHQQPAPLRGRVPRTRAEMRDQHEAYG